MAKIKEKRQITSASKKKKSKSANDAGILTYPEVIDITPESEKNKENLPIVRPSQELEAVDLSNPLALYMKEVNKVALLTPDQEKALALRYFDSKDAQAFKQLVQSNLRFVVKIAFEYSKYGAKVLDLIQEGNLGPLKAVQEFNPYKEVRLITYAVYWIRSYIQDFLLRNWSLVRIGTTSSQKKLFYRLKKEQERLEREGFPITPLAIAQSLNVDESDVKMMQERMQGKDLSLSKPIGEDADSKQMSWQDRVSDPSPLAYQTLESLQQSDLFKNAISEFQDELDDREKLIFEKRLLAEKPITLIEIGTEFGVSKERARQLEERILDKLRQFLAKHYPDISIRD